MPHLDSDSTLDAVATAWERLYGIPFPANQATVVFTAVERYNGGDQARELHRGKLQAAIAEMSTGREAQTPHARAVAAVLLMVMHTCDELLKSKQH